VLKYPIGARFKVVGQELRADNGTFEIIYHLPLADGDDYYVYGRVGSDGKLSNNKNWFNRRSNFASKLERMATIVNQ
jgi:hypothetical protein